MSLPQISTAERNARATNRVGTVLCERWHLDELLGAGGMATVYAATHRNGSRVAIKLLHPELADYADIRERFLEEGYAANRVGPPGVVAVLDEGVTDESAVFLVMELLEGRTLEQLCSEGPAPSLSDALRITDEVLAVLERAHEKGVIHRDIKPDNIFITSSGELKILDFGIARVTESRRTHPTEVGSAMGTPAFMPPEQARGRWDLIDERTDLWALGATMFWAISGQFVHEASTVNEELLLAMTVRARSLAAAAPTVPSELVRFIDRALAFEQHERYESARAMRVALRKLVSTLNESELGLSTVPRDTSTDAPSSTLGNGLPSIRPVTASYRPPKDGASFRALASAAAAIVLLAGTGGWAFLRSQPESPPPEPAASAPAASAPLATSAPALEPPVVIDLDDVSATDSAQPNVDAAPASMPDRERSPQSTKRRTSARKRPTAAPAQPEQPAPELQLQAATNDVAEPAPRPEATTRDPLTRRK